MSFAHSNISIFVTHLGCPNRCSFCNQRYIAGTTDMPTAETVSNAVNSAKNHNPKTTEIAFFGGSFTAIDRDYMLELLKSAYTYVLSGDVCGIRISTRPDAIDDEILTLLKKYGVTAIELGAQSMCDDVLTLNKRGHTAKDVESASVLIKKYGFSLGLQMMTGLYGDTVDNALFTAEQFIKLKPDTVRIYPTIVLENTDLADYYRQGVYKVMSLDDTVDLVCKLLKMFNDSGINVIRTGLHTIDEQSYVAGPWHPAFSELCQSKMYLETALKKLKKQGKYIIYVKPNCISKMIGQKRTNINKLNNMGYDCTVKPKDNLSEYEIEIKDVNE